MAASTEDSVVFVIRHGDRFDRELGGWDGKARWWAHPDDTPLTTDVGSFGVNAHDPPLSAMGERQAIEIGAWLAAASGSNGVPPIKKLLVSPYIRTCQTAAPLAAQLSLQMLLEDGVSEGTAPPQYGGCYHIPMPAERFPYLPCIDLTYAPVYPMARDFQEDYRQCTSNSCNHLIYCEFRLKWPPLCQLKTVLKSGHFNRNSLTD